MKWRTKRQLTILLIVFTPIVLLAALWFYLSRPEPSCFDGVSNQDEEGIDCGGVCENICIDQVPTPITEWSRSFGGGESVSAVALIRNGTDTFSASNVAYIFRLLDSEGVLVKEYKGRADIPAIGNFAVYVPSIEIGSREVSLTTFQFVEQPGFVKSDTVGIRFGDKDVRSFDLGTRVTSKARLISDVTLKNVIIVAIVSDEDGTVFEVSQTLVESFEPGTSEDLVFTWPQDITSEAVFIDFYLSSYTISKQ